ncbi:hypothetical protein L5515_009096 [Caenorhabditis briggsae]|uniref:Uncharacterized protein n=1 Tax=Caenorhabditis briggsae TaxID=6238 RepID=A0AAE9JPL6_CAEBR|nr:hypothetical protein L5515_009096 [Caenorhabditis briggsae]
MSKSFSDNHTRRNSSVSIKILGTRRSHDLKKYGYQIHKESSRLCFNTAKTKSVPVTPLTKHADCSESKCCEQYCCSTAANKKCCKAGCASGCKWAK